MTDILFTNDDSYRSIGFYPLLNKLSKKYNVTSIAPIKNKSWISKSITIEKKFAAKKIKLKNHQVWGVHGTPADCVQIGLHNILNQKPNLVVSGINNGENAGIGHILSSGTIGACIESAIDGVKSVAFSLNFPFKIKKKTDLFDPKNFHIFENASIIASKFVNIIIDKKFPRGVDLFSVNIPFNADNKTDFKITRPFKAPYGRLFKKIGNKYIYRSNYVNFKNLSKDSDIYALKKGFVSITPMNLDLVRESTLSKVNDTIRKEW